MRTITARILAFLVQAVLVLAYLDVTACSGPTAAPPVSPTLAPEATATEAANPSTAIPPAAGPIRIGAVFNLTGDLASLDDPASKGAMLAAEQINDAGGVNGQPIDLVVIDTKNDVKAIARAATELITTDKAAALLGYTDTDSVLTFGPMAQAAGMPFVTVAATSPRIPAQVGDEVFLACFGDNVQAAAAAEYASKSFGQSAAVLWDDGEEYTALLAQNFKARFAELGGQVVFDDHYADTATTWVDQIAKLKALPEQPDFYFISAMPHNIGALIRDLRAAGLTTPIIGGDGYDTPDLVATAGPAAENVYFTTHALMDASSGTEAIRKFMGEYHATYGEDPENAFAALGYDTVKLVADAIRRAGSTDRAAIVEAIAATRDFPGITGQISYTPGVNVPRKGVTIIAIKEGKLTLAAEVVPDKVPEP